ncbi:MAG: O-antigen ligase family protein [Candidatus Limnocylindria bacterium]
MSDDALTLPHGPGTFISWRPSSAALLTVAAVMGLLVAAVLVAPVSIPGLVIVGIGLAVLLAFASMRWPRTVVVLVVISPLFDRYILAPWLPADIGALANFLSEALLLTVGTALAIRAWAEGRLLAAFRHPVTVALLAFVALSGVSALVNAVPIAAVVLGLGMTLDAAACFYLPRLAGFSVRHALVATAVFIGIVTVAALGGLGQALLDPNLFGLTAWQGRYGEVIRLASIFSDPNTLGAVLIGGIPFAIFGITSLHNPRQRLAAVALALLFFVPLYLSFSRGAWGGLLVGGSVGVLLVSWRALAVGVVVAALGLGLAMLTPRGMFADVPPPPPTAPQQPPPGPAEEPNLIESTIARIAEIGRGKDLRTLFVVNAVPIIGDHPLVGVGPGRYGGAAASLLGTPVYAEYQTDALFGDPEQTTVDNFWLHLLVESGLLGTIAFAAAGLAAFVPIVRAARRSRGWVRVMLGGMSGGIAALVANSITTMLLEANSVAFMTWFLLGIGAIVAAGILSAPRDAEPERDPERAA